MRLCKPDIKVTDTLTWIAPPMFCMVLNILAQYPPSNDSYLDLDRAPYVVYGVKYIDLVSL